MCEQCDRELADMQEKMVEARKKMLTDDHLGPLGDRYVPMHKRSPMTAANLMPRTEEAMEMLVNGVMRAQLLQVANQTDGGAYLYVGLSNKGIPPEARKFQVIVLNGPILFYFALGRFRLSITRFDMHVILDLYSMLRLQLSRILVPTAHDVGTITSRGGPHDAILGQVEKMTASHDLFNIRSTKPKPPLS